MVHLNDNTMAEPHATGWQDVLKTITDVTPWLVIGSLIWKGIDKVFQYFSEARDAELRKIVHEEMKPQIDNLSDKIEDLSKAIWNMTNKK